jgi:2-C-methyl-D-erythritol 4-phosphate cytidylyltransferase
MAMERYVIIVAGGSGERMQHGIPKQFIPVGGKPVLMHTMAAFRTALPDIHMVVVLPEKHIKLWKDLCTEFSCTISHTITAGGKTRFYSVRQGLRMIRPGTIVGIHDGVRPFVSRQTILTAFETAEKTGTAVPVVELNDSLRMLSNGTTHPADRAHFRLVQTPQVFKADLLLEAYKANYRKGFTDDASVVEAAGHTITLTEGNFENIKITRSVDLAFAEVLTKKRFVI